MIADPSPADGNTPVPVRWITDSGLSLDARGLLVKIVDATRWQPFDVPDLLERIRPWLAGDSPELVGRSLRELSDAGYLVRDGRHYRLANPEG